MELSRTPDVWWADIHEHTSCEALCRSFLDSDELARADRFRFSYLRRGYCIAHGLLRHILGRYLNTAPESITFARGRYCKPYLASSALFFNMSHSGERVIFAFSSESPLGIDIEAMQPRASIKELPLGIFTREVQEEIRSLPAEEQKEVFYRRWTQFEAILKAKGDGLYGAVVDEDWNRWAMHSFFLEGGYIGALASKRALSRLPQRYSMLDDS